MQVQEAVKRETIHIFTGTTIGVCVMFVAFFGLHQIAPQAVPFDYRVILGGIAGGFVASVNFFLMAITVQDVVSVEDDKKAFDKMKTSYRYRTMLQLGWAILALVVPYFNGAAGIIPLFLPSISIKALGFLGLIKK
ncbi:ATP synthase subunit I [Lachnospiraceae bacterium 62-35]